MSTPSTPRTRGLIKAAAHAARAVNQSHSGQRITPQEAQALLSVLRKHDGSTLTPDLDYQARANVSNLFDKLRLDLMGRIDKGGA
jgi:hypothetical protein